jgi:hypothetical protein
VARRIFVGKMLIFHSLSDPLLSERAALLTMQGRLLMYSVEHSRRAKP